MVKQTIDYDILTNHKHHLAYFTQKMTMYKLIDGLNQGLVPTDMGQNYFQAKTDQRRTQTRTAIQRSWDYSDHELYCDRKLHFYGSK